MSIATRINILVIGTILVLCSIVCAYVIDREYRVLRHEIVEGVESAVIGRPDLQVAIYFGDRSHLQEFIDGLAHRLDLPRIALVNVNGEPVVASGSAPARLPAFNRIRPQGSATETEFVTLDGEMQTVGGGLWRGLFDPARRSHLTVAVSSLLNPLSKSLTRADFARAMLETGEVRSQHVVAYIYLDYSPRELLDSILPTILLTVLGCALLALLCAMVSVRVTRRITAPLARLAGLADDIAAGRVTRAVDIDGGGEISGIAHMLNEMIGGLSQYKTQMDVDHKLLSMKVEERTEQLARRNDELNEAVEEVTQAKERLRKMAYYDSLTQLPNRRMFAEQLELLLRLTRRNKEQLGLIFLDLDNFKRINDSLGHSAGDQLLKEVAVRLSSCVRDSDLVGHHVEAGPRIDVSRLGGDEFTVVLNKLDTPESAAIVAQRMLDTLVHPILIDGNEVVVTPSLGIAIFPGDAEDVEGMLKVADTAMYHAKLGGKNKYVFYQSEMNEPGLERLQLETELRKAAERGQLELHYQPQVDARNGAVVGAEALLRWQHPEHGQVPPFKFIPLAEEAGLIGELGDWVLREACKQVKSFADQGLKLPRVSVNISPLQFNKRFIETVKGTLEEFRIDPGVLQLELTESELMEDSATTVAILHELKALGVELAIDDFGTGYSSLSYLSRFPLDELKIDRSFVIKCLESEQDAGVVNGIIALGRSLDLSLVAEGVETQEQFALLTGGGAHVIQGYLFSKPVPADQLTPMLAPWHFMRQIQLMTEELAEQA